MGGHLRLLCFFRQANTTLAYFSMSQPHLGWAHEHLKIKTVHILELVWFMLEPYSFHIYQTQAGFRLTGPLVDPLAKKLCTRLTPTFIQIFFLCFS